MKLFLERNIYGVNLETGEDYLVTSLETSQLDKPLNPSLDKIVECCECSEKFSNDKVLDGIYWMFIDEAKEYDETFDEKDFYACRKIQKAILESMKK